MLNQFVLVLMICGALDCHPEPSELRYRSMIACLEAGFTLMEQQLVREWNCEKIKRHPARREKREKSGT